MNVTGFLVHTFCQGFVGMYRSTHHRVLPATYPDRSGHVVRIDRCDSRRAYLDSSSESLKADKRELLDREGVREDLFIVQGVIGITGTCAMGTNTFRSGDAAIYIDHDMYETDRAYTAFAVNHEIKHILSDDAIKRYVAVAVNDLARPAMWGVGCVRGMRAFPGRGVPGVVGSLLGTVASRFTCNRMVDAISRRQEVEADDFAIANATDEELRGGWRRFTSMKRVNADVVKGVRNLLVEDPVRPLGVWWESIRCSAEGEDVFTLIHPTFKDRIHKIENALAVRGVRIDEMAERPAVEKLRIYEVKGRRRIFVSEGISPRSHRAIMYDMLGTMIPDEDPADMSERT
ncbi:MAG: M48 family metalloprotease [Simkaniaceae bacterium]|nr:M48 family metalloprotease [Simkaniaceae bacterium]